MLSALLVGVLAAAPFSVAIPNLNGVKLAPGEAELHTTVLANALSRRGARVVSQRDLAATIGLERQRQLLGSCDDSCMAELAAALGTDTLLVGDLGLLGSSYTLSLKLIRSSDGSVLATHTGSARDADALRTEWDRAAWSLLKQASAKFPEVNPGREPGAAGFARTWAIVPGLLGVAGMTLGVVGALSADANFRGLTASDTLEAARGFRDAGKGWRTIAAVGFGVGAAALVAAAIVFFTGESASAVPSAWWLPDGTGGVAVRGSL